MKRVLLINMPFAGVEFPSLALGLFRAKFESDAVACRVEYLNLLFAEMVGLDNYGLIGQYNGLFAGEQMFASSLFGNYVPDDSQYYSNVVSPACSSLPYRLAQMKAQVVPFLERCLASIDWSAYDVIGFSSLFEQNLPSLALAYHVKRLFPRKVIVFGGANCEDIMGVKLHRCFPFIDFVFGGEADDTFPELVKRLSYGHPVADIPGLVYRTRNGESVYTGDGPKTDDLDTLPFPNFDEFYTRPRAGGPLAGIGAWIVMETSRGCWWGQKAKCAFCGLNGKNVQFRRKSASRILAELQFLLRKYSSYNVGYVRMVDNVIAQQHLNDLLPQLADLKLGVSIFFEVRPTLRKHEMKALAEARVKDVQGGLESLNSHMLQLMRKGVTSLQNIQVLKWAKQYGVTASWNVIFGFPGEVAEDYANSLEMAKILTHLTAPTGFGPFRMDRFSHALEHAADIGLINVRPQSVYRYLYPFDDATLFDLCYYFDFDYRQPIDNGGYLFPFLNQVNEWKTRYDQLWSYRADDDRVFIQDTRLVATSPQHVLDGIRGLIYEYCDRSRTAAQIRNWLAGKHGVGLTQSDVESMLNEFIANKLMVKDESSYVALAVMTYEADFEREEAA